MRLIDSFFLMLYFLLSAGFCFAQKQNHQWRFGAQGGISFLTSPPSFVPGAQLITGEGSASVADPATGELLFYTDGVSVWNAQNQLMPNGTGLLGGDQTLLSSTTAAVIIPRPGSQTLYYIVTIDEQSSSNGVRYNLVDMALAGGLGDIVAGQKNLPLFQTGSEKLEVVPAANGQDFWLITKDNPGNSFYAFLLTAAGFQTTPVVSTIGGTQGNGAGHLKVNRQFNKLACGSLFDGTMELFDFNNATGEITGVIAWDLDSVMLAVSPLIYGVEFSPSGQFLYISNLSSVFQYDVSLVQALAIQNSAYLVYNGGFSQAASLQLGPDDKIYLNAGTVDVIQNPNSPGASCNFQNTAIANLAGGGGYGLPKWVYALEESVVRDVVASDSCTDSFILFSLTDTSGVQQIIWLYGDTSSPVTQIIGSGAQPLHFYTQPGTYTITAIVTSQNGIDTIRLVDLPIVDCSVDSSYTDINFTNDSCSLSSVAFSLSGNQLIEEVIEWTVERPGGVIDTLPADTPVYVFPSPGIYSVCCVLQINCTPPPDINNPIVTPCFYIDTICTTVSIVDCTVPCSGTIAFTGDSCLSDPVSFTASSNYSILSAFWNFGDPGGGTSNTSTQINPQHIFSEAGLYSVQCILALDCGLDTLTKLVTVNTCADTVVNCPLFVPNAFSPNGDGSNDLFRAESNCPFTFYSLQVFNRWGEKVFQTNNPATAWSGEYRNQRCPVGVYVYNLQYRFAGDQGKSIQGSVTLVR